MFALSHAPGVEWYILAIPVESDGSVAPVFGRSPHFAIVDVKANTVKIIPNPYKDVKHGAGLQ